MKLVTAFLFIWSSGQDGPPLISGPHCQEPPIPSQVHRLPHSPPPISLATLTLFLLVCILPKPQAFGRDCPLSARLGIGPAKAPAMAAPAPKAAAAVKPAAPAADLFGTDPFGGAPDL